MSFDSHTGNGRQETTPVLDWTALGARIVALAERAAALHLELGLTGPPSDHTDGDVPQPRRAAQ